MSNDLSPLEQKYAKLKISGVKLDNDQLELMFGKDILYKLMASDELQLHIATQQAEIQIRKHEASEFKLYEIAELRGTAIDAVRNALLYGTVKEQLDAAKLVLKGALDYESAKARVLGETEALADSGQNLNNFPSLTYDASKLGRDGSAS